MTSQSRFTPGVFFPGSKKYLVMTGAYTGVKRREMVVYLSSAWLAVFENPNGSRYHELFVCGGCSRK